MTPDGTLSVSEVFGNTVQGEGPYSGHPCCFLRLGHCNLSCPPCDTPYTWDTSRFDLAETCPPWTGDRILQELSAFTAPLLIVSGGEPLLWQRTPTFRRVTEECGKTVHVETNGTIVPDPDGTAAVSHFSVSPKLSAMGGADQLKRRIKARAIAAFAELASGGTACFKFVCAAPEHVDEVSRFAVAHGLDPATVWIMPEGVTAETMLSNHRAVAPAVLMHGFKTTTRLHLLLNAR